MGVRAEYLFWACFTLTLRVTSQDLQTGNGNGPPTLRDYRDNENNNRILLHYQAIIHTYKFNSCGNITEWGADVFQNDQGRYALDFQVWRPSPTTDPTTGTGCYSLVGNNRFASISLSGGIARVTPSPQDYIQYQSGDMLGVYVESASPILSSTRPDNGVVIQITNDFTKDTIWYTSIAPTMATSKGLDCPYTVGEPGGLMSSRRGAPVISIATTANPCPISSPVYPPVITTPVSLSTTGSPLIAPTLISTVTVTETKIPTNSETDLTLPIWLIVTIAVVAVVFAVTCTCVLGTAVLIIKKRGTRAHAGARKENLHNIIIQNEIYDQASIKSIQSIKLKDSKKIERDDMSDTAGYHVPTPEARASWRDGVIPEDAIHHYNKTVHEFFQEEQVYWAPASTTSALYSQLASKKYREIPKEQLKMLEQVGSGEYGRVYRAEWSISGTTKEIAVKTLRAGSSEEEKVRFLQEAAIMGQFSHPCIVRLYGVVTVGEQVMICIELMAKSDLRQYLCAIDKNHQDHKSSRQGKRFLQFSQQIASGMEYLSKKSFIHRDLAARNILLDEALHCKIGDFGMARDLMNENYYIPKAKGGKIPIRWTAPEAIFYKKFSTDSDVWSYGMVLFEIWSVGKEPFPELINDQAMKEIQTGHCQPPPPGCPRAIYKLMVDCWKVEHHQRPSFGQIITYLQQPIDLNQPVYQGEYSELSIENFDKSCQSQYSVITSKNLNQASNGDLSDELVSNEAYGMVEWETKFKP